MCNKEYREARKELQEQINKLERVKELLSEDVYEENLPVAFRLIRNTKFNTVKTYSKTTDFLVSRIIEELTEEVREMATPQGSQLIVDCGNIRAYIPTLNTDSIQVYGLRKPGLWLKKRAEVTILRKINKVRTALKQGNKSKARFYFYGTTNKFKQLVRAWDGTMTENFVEARYREYYSKVAELAVRQKEEIENYNRDYKKFEEVVFPALKDYADGEIKIVNI